MAVINSDNLISNMSYTEKDFQTIYPALLDLVKKESARWDPTASNESDPGVLLLKLNAIIADKCNYNIDKNVLECFPVSVTQNRNARQLYEQLGYYMHWYKAASTIVTIKYAGSVDDETVRSYTIPRFTMVSDEQNDIIYTLIETRAIKNTGTAVAFSALQGVAVNYAINGETLITTANLDSNNRLYFDESNIAENGIFITNYGDNNYSSWKRKDNLLIEEVSSTNFFYKFGVSQDLSTCYIEFPENAEEIFQEGINITYLKTSGASGNTATGTLTTFYDASSISDSENESTIQLTDSSFKVSNYVVGSGGANAETISEAYRGYKKVVGTFDTLITLRDYLNAARNSDYVSNAIVSDRTSDIQSTYKIISKSGSLNMLLNEVEMSNAYDVYGYLREEPVEGGGTRQVFYLDKSQEPDPKYANEATPDVSKNYFDRDTGISYRVIFLNKTVKYIEADKVEHKALSAFDLKLYILSATSLMDSATNYKTTFTLNTDEIVRSIVEDDLSDYKCVQHNFTDLLPNKICFIKNKYPLRCKIIPQYALTTSQRDEVIKAVQLALYQNLNSSVINFGEEITYDNIYNIILNADSRIKTLALDPISYRTYAVYLLDLTQDGETFKLYEEDITDYILDSEGKLDESEIANQFRLDIYAKSVLAGKTRFFVQDTKFNYMVNQKYQLLKEDVGRIDTNLDITLSNANDWTYNLRENEVIEIYSPNLIEYRSFSNNARVEYYIPSGIVTANSSYSLKSGEFVIFYYKEDSSTEYFNYQVYGEGAIIRPTFTMNASVSQLTDLVGNELTRESLLITVTVGSQTYKYGSGNTGSEAVSPTLQTKVKNLTGSNNLLSGEKEIDILLQNMVTVNQEYLCYWILNEQTDGKYILFSADSTETERILNAGEYFIYMDPESNDTAVLGSGTFIRRSSDDLKVTFSCIASVTYEEFVSGGSGAIADYMVNLPRPLTVVEMQYKAFAEGTYIRISPELSTYISIQLVRGEFGYKIEHSIRSTVYANVNYKLLSDEYIITYMPVYEPDSSGEQKVVNYKYFVCGPGTVINSTYTLTAATGTSQSLIGKRLTALDICKPHTEAKSAAVELCYFSDDYGDTKDYDKLTEAVTTSVSDLPTGAVLNINALRKIVSSLNLNSNITTSLSDYTISYRTSLNDTWSVVPAVVLDSKNLSWKGRALLRLNTSSTSPQKLYQNQSVKFYTYDSVNEHIIVDDDEAKYKEIWDLVKPITIKPESYKVEPVYILTEDTFSILGPHITTLSKDTDDSFVPTSSYVYLYGTEKDYITYLDSGIAEIKFNTGEEIQTVDLDFRLPAGNYILPLLNNNGANPDDEKILTNVEALIRKGEKGAFEAIPLMSENAKYFDASASYKEDDEVLYRTSSENTDRFICIKTPAEGTHPVPTDTTYWKNLGQAFNLVNPKNYYLNLSDLPDGPHTLEEPFFITLRLRVTFIAGKKSSLATLYIYPIYKYERTEMVEYENLNNELFDKIFNRIKELDYNNNFDYTYVVNEDEEIKDPLDSWAYLDSNHIFNEYTICQMETAKEKFSIQLTNIIK